MSLGTIDQRAPGHPRFSHEALFYRGQDEFVDTISSFAQEGVDAGEPVLVVVSQPKIDALRRRMGRAASAVRFSDMAEVGRNPARIIPAWAEFVDEYAGTGVAFRGVGEPIGAHLGHEKLVECQVHEALLNLAFAASPGWRLVCPYDLDSLDPLVIDAAYRSHPVIIEGGRRFPSPSYADPEAVVADLEDGLEEPPVPLVQISFADGAELSGLRRAVADCAALAGLTPDRVDDLVLAVNELATNSLCHGGGTGTVRVWRQRGAFVCEVGDAGYFHQLLVGRQLPARGLVGGRGFWLVNQLCDLVQVRSLPTGTKVRVHVSLP